eukprot:4894899-Amphidinium_carterae.1
MTSSSFHPQHTVVLCSPIEVLVASILSKLSRWMEISLGLSERDIALGSLLCTLVSFTYLQPFSKLARELLTRSTSFDDHLQDASEASTLKEVAPSLACGPYSE